MKWNFECRRKQGDKIHVLATAQCRRSSDRGPAIVCACIKDNLDHAVTGRFLESLDREAENMIRIAQTLDHGEAARPFVEAVSRLSWALKRHQERLWRHRLRTRECPDFTPKGKNGFPGVAVQDDPAALDPRIPSEIVPAAAIPGQHRSRNR